MSENKCKDEFMQSAVDAIERMQTSKFVTEKIESRYGLDIEEDLHYLENSPRGRNWERIVARDILLKLGITSLNAIYNLAIVIKQLNNKPNGGGKVIVPHVEREVSFIASNPMEEFLHNNKCKAK